MGAFERPKSGRPRTIWTTTFGKATHLLEHSDKYLQLSQDNAMTNCVTINRSRVRINPIQCSKMPIYEDK